MILPFARRFGASLLVFAFVAIVLPVSAGAQSTGLRINPRTDLTIKPGESQSANLLIANLNKNVPVTVDLSVVDFTASGETGTPSPILKDNVDPTPWSLRPFITIPKSVTLAKGETKYVPFTVTVPNGQGAGSYYSAIKYDPKPAQDKDSVIISGAPMELVFVTVPGKATELLVPKQFGAYVIKDDEKNGHFSSLFIQKQPQKLAYLLENRGTVAESPSGSIVIKNMFGQTVKTIKSANPKANLVLLGQTRRFEVCIDSTTKTMKQDGRDITVETCRNPGLLPGMYRAQLLLLYGINGSATQQISTSTVFWYLPLWFIGVVLLVLALIAYILYRIRQRLVGVKKHRRQR